MSKVIQEHMDIQLMPSIMLKLSDIEPNKGQIDGLPKNPRFIKDDKFKKLVKSIEDNPEMTAMREILVYPMSNGKYVIIGGNMRYRAMKELKYKEAPCKVIPQEATTEQLKAYTLKDNSGYGEWDFDLLNNEWDLSMLEDCAIDLPEIGAEAIADEAEPQEAKEDDFDETKDDIPARVQKGEVWKLGEHRLMCGDSTDEGCVKTLMGGVLADMVVSDPPYGMHLDTDFSSCKGSLNSIGRKNNTRGNKYERVIGDNDDFTPQLITTFFENFPQCKEVFLFGADYFAELLPDKNEGSWLVWDKRKESQADAIGSEFELVWSKNKHKRRMLRHDWFGFLSSQNGADARNRVHPTQKPVTLIVDIINQWGKEKVKIVDLYGGSGTTLIACEQLNRKCFMMEFDPHYCDVIIARWEKLTGKQAEKVS